MYIYIYIYMYSQSAQAASLPPEPPGRAARLASGSSIGMYRL